MMAAADLARRLGLKRYPHSWWGRCPACDYPSTFSIRAGRDGRALLYCASCQDRDALAEAMKRATGQEPQREPHGDSNIVAVRQRTQDAALRLWRGSEPATGTPADVYLTRRGLSGLAASPALRFRGDVPHPEGGRLPALVGLVQDAAGVSITIHRTFITRDG
jgi:putative DNA primase/helicase